MVTSGEAVLTEVHIMSRITDLILLKNCNRRSRGGFEVSRVVSRAIPLSFSFLLSYSTRSAELSSAKLGRADGGNRLPLCEEFGQPSVTEQR